MEVKQLQFSEIIEIATAYTWTAFTYIFMTFKKKKAIQRKKNKQPLLLNAFLSFVSGVVRCSSAVVV